MALTEKEENILVDVAKKAIQCKLDGKEPCAFFHIEGTALNEKGGVFVTLKKSRRLRGCIGHIRAEKPLYKTVEEMAVASAFNDPRFPPLRRDELPSLTVEISVLTPLKIIKEINEIEVGVHGLYIVKDYRSGLLLPQVATERKWNRMTFVEETCYKAGLPQDAWKEQDTKIYIFSAEVFSRPWQE
jgi:AmmeMemoRadiSam system protein A